MLERKGKKKNICLVKVNMLAMKNLFHQAIEKLAKLNLAETRFNANGRKERERERLLREEVWMTKWLMKVLLDLIFKCSIELVY